ncbi:hypothetical protein RJ639_013573 [Escallonia herrerae]|uniref:Protein kinase domain-containing protein n=1 Tax=Escallonia herrerae TaxID=1293975 RepID=A0AA89ALB1_9ASTE|nr:hypothetical protein RJ639_013573 [Escallonia herrerae]
MAATEVGMSLVNTKVCDQPEGCNVLESPATCVSAAGSECPGSSNHYRDTLEGDLLNRSSRSLLGTELPCTSPCSMGDTALMVEELTIRNYNIPNSAMVRSSSTSGEKDCRQSQWQHLYQLAGGPRNQNPYGDHGFRDMARMPPSPGKDLWKPPHCFQASKSLLTKQDSRFQDELAANSIYSHLKIFPSNIQTLGDDRSKGLSSSNFSQFFAMQSLKGKGVVSRTPEAFAEYSVAATGQKEDKRACVSAIASDALLTSSTKLEQPSQHSTDNIDTESFSEGISLKKWLKPGREISKVERLHLFRQIVQLVDAAHSQQVALQDLRLSSFVLLPSNRVKYCGLFTQEKIPSLMKQEINGKRALEQERFVHSDLGVKQQKLRENMKRIRHQPQLSSPCGFSSEAVNEIVTDISGLPDIHITQCEARNSSNHQRTSLQTQNCSMIIQLEKNWYACPDELNNRGLLSSNIYSLGVLLFELLYCSAPSERLSEAMLDLRHRILPPEFLSRNPKEAGFCLWLLHPDPLSRPSTRDILLSEIICGYEELYSGGDFQSCVYKEDDIESELLLDFLTSLEELKQKQVSELLGYIGWLETDIREVEGRHVLSTSSHWIGKNLTYAKGWGAYPEDCANPRALPGSFSGSNMLEARLMRNIGQLESAYLYKRSQIHLTETASTKRSDKDLLKSHDRLSQPQIKNDEPRMGRKTLDPLGDFLEGICKFARYSKFEVCGTLRNSDLLNSSNVICSLSFDRDEEYIAAAGVSKKIKVFDFSSIMDASVDIHYPAVEMSNKSKLSCVCWNKYIKNYLASTDYDGVVRVCVTDEIKIWDASTGQGFSQHIEHQKRAWSLDFSQVNPTMFASGSDDCSVKLWSINERSSIGAIINPANVCCVQFSPYSSHLLAFGSADYKIYCYDIRHTRIPWCTLGGHGKAVSYVRFLDSENIVSASTDNSLKLWDLNKTSLEGLSSDACSLTFSGHTNEKNFVGLSVLDGYIACGSETNEVYAYHRSLPMPVTSHQFGYVDPVTGDEISDGNGQFVSNVCWRGKSKIVVAANSSGSIKLLQMV